MPKVTIVVPGYNAEQYIEQCLDSVVSQTLTDIEVLLINDGSTDATGKIFERYAKQYSFVRVIHQENSGIFFTRAKAIREARGEYIGWVDADDYAEKTMFEELYTAASQHDSELVYCDYDFFPIRPKEKDKWFRPYQGVLDVAYVERNSQFWNKIVKKDLLIRLGIDVLLPKCFEESMILCLLMAERPIAISKKLYHYRVGHGGMSSRYQNVAYYQRFIESSKELKKALDVYFPDAYWTDYSSFRIIYYHLMTAIVAANAADKNAYSECIRTLRSAYPHFKRNQHYRGVLKSIYGSTKAFAIGYLVPVNYLITRVMCKIGFR